MRFSRHPNQSIPSAEEPSATDWRADRDNAIASCQARQERYAQARDEARQELAAAEAAAELALSPEVKALRALASATEARRKPRPESTAWPTRDRKNYWPLLKPSGSALVVVGILVGSESQ